MLLLKLIRKSPAAQCALRSFFAVNCQDRRCDEVCLKEKENTFSKSMIGRGGEGRGGEQDIRKASLEFLLIFNVHSSSLRQKFVEFLGRNTSIPWSFCGVLGAGGGKDLSFGLNRFSTQMKICPFLKGILRRETGQFGSYLGVSYGLFCARTNSPIQIRYYP